MVERPVLALQTLPEAERRMVGGPESGRQTAWEQEPEHRTEQEVEHQMAAAAELAGEPARQMVEVLAQVH